jgi:hypothetical protein
MKLIALVLRLALPGLVAGSALLHAESANDLTVAVKTTPRSPWTNHATRVVSSLPATVTQQTDPALDQYGGLASRKAKATGFFYPAQIDGRWWLVDPEGGLFIAKGVVSVTPIGGATAKAAFNEEFGSAAKWAAMTTDLLRDHGFNSLGAWTDTAAMRRAPRPLAYTRILNFMSAYGRKRGGTYQQPGHTGYPNDCIFVFDPEFEAFCDNHARQLANDKDDPFLLGHFSDNEMPLKRDALKNYLRLPAQDPGQQAALTWLQKRHGAQATEKDITEQDRTDFLALVVDRYLSIVSKAIKKYDPNHLFLGSRFHGGELSYPEVFKAAGPYLDVVAVNYYRAWTPSLERLAMWSRESGKPVIITEWYAKGEDSGMPNNSGAGWIVKTQADRGRFYKNFTLGLLESKVCVGWQWFKYGDNDPTDKNTDPSNRDSNKGIVSARYNPYTPLLDAMKELNVRVYALADYFDRKPALSN